MHSDRWLPCAVGLKERGHVVEFFCYAPGDFLADPLKQSGIPINLYLKKWRFSPAVIFALINKVRRGKYDILLSFLRTPNFYAIVARCLQLHRPRLVISERRNDIPGEGKWGLSLLRQMYRLSDFLVVNSNTQHENLEREYPWIKPKIITIYNGYDLKDLCPATHEPQNEILHILVVSSVLPRKNGLCLVRALAILKDRYGLCPWVTWVGERVLKGKPFAYYQQMCREIAENNLENQWQWLGQRKDIIQFFHQTDVLVHPSYGEGLPNVVCEAMACARPVIVSNILDHPYLVEHQKSGFLFDWRDPEDLANWIKIFSEMSSIKRHEMGIRGRAFAEKNLGLGRFASDYEKLFLKLFEG